MLNSQFKFSLSVGSAMTATGGIIATSAPIGIPLAVLGVAIIGIAILSKNMTSQSRREPILLQIPVNEGRKKPYQR